MYIVHLLRESNIRTMDIAKLMSISERSVSRLMAKIRDKHVIDINEEIIQEVHDLIAKKDEILSGEAYQKVEELQETESHEKPPPANDSKRQLAVSLLAMNVKTKDICKMLGVPEKTVQNWKLRKQQQQQFLEEYEEDVADDHSEFVESLKEEDAETYEEYGEYE